MAQVQMSNILWIFLSLTYHPLEGQDKIWQMITPLLDERINLFIWGGNTNIENGQISELKAFSSNFTKNMKKVFGIKGYQEEELHLVYADSIMDLNLKLEKLSGMMSSFTPNCKFRKFIFLPPPKGNISESSFQLLSFPFDSQVYLGFQNGDDIKIFEVYSVGNQNFKKERNVLDLSSLRSNLQNGHLRISIYCHPQNDVIVDYLAGTKVSCTSIMKQIDKFQFSYLDIFIYLLNFTYTPIDNKNHPFDQGLRNIEGGSEPQRLLENHLVDLESYPHPLQEFVAKKFAYIQPIFNYGRLSVYFRQPPANTVRNLYTESFTFWVWISAILTFFAFFVSLLSFYFIQSYHQIRPTPLDAQSISNIAFKLLGVFSSNGWTWHIGSTAPSIKFLFLMSSLLMLVLQANYLGQITTSLSFIVLPINSFGKLIDFNFGFIADTSMGSILTYFQHLQITYKIKDKPITFPHEINEIGLFNAMKLTRKATMTIPRYFLASEVDHSSICPFISRLEIKEVNIIQGSFVLPKYSPYQEAFNRNAIKMIGGGISRRLTLYYKETPEFINCPQGGLRKYLEMAIGDVFVAFAILILGIILSSLAYLIEYFSNL